MDSMAANDEIASRPCVKLGCWITGLKGSASAALAFRWIPFKGFGAFREAVRVLGMVLELRVMLFGAVDHVGDACLTFFDLVASSGAGRRERLAVSHAGEAHATGNLGVLMRWCVLASDVTR